MSGRQDPFPGRSRSHVGQEEVLSVEGDVQEEPGGAGAKQRPEVAGVAHQIRVQGPGGGGVGVSGGQGAGGGEGGTNQLHVPGPGSSWVGHQQWGNRPVEWGRGLEVGSVGAGEAVQQKRWRGATTLAM